MQLCREKSRLPYRPLTEDLRQRAPNRILDPAPLVVNLESISMDRPQWRRAARLFFFFSPVQQTRSGIGNQHAECEKQQKQQQPNVQFYQRKFWLVILMVASKPQLRLPGLVPVESTIPKPVNSFRDLLEKTVIFLTWWISPLPAPRRRPPRAVQATSTAIICWRTPFF